MPWRKLGLLIAAPPRLPFAVSHASLPAVEQLEDGRWRVYFSTRDDRRRSHIVSCDVDIDAAQPRVSAARLVLAPGSLGAFDDAGVTMSCIVSSGDERHLYYSGWSLGVSVPFYFYVGCAHSSDRGATFKRVSEAPLLERNAVDPYLTASPWVLRDGAVWKMWYVSGTEWLRTEDGEPKHRYNIRYAQSNDGHQWDRTGRICVGYRDAAEYAIARPCVLAEKNGYRMWFSARGDTYRIWQADSSDGLEWSRREVVLGPSGDKWDADMQAYPVVVDHHGRRYMLYNGNGYGATGIGYAILDPDDS